VQSIKRDRYLWLALLFSFAMILVMTWSDIVDPYSLEEDFRNWYWMHLFQDQELFPSDRFIERHIIEIALGPINLFVYKSSPLYGLLYQLLSNFVPFILLGKLQVFPLTLIAVYFLYRISERFVSPLAAMAICAIFVLMNFVLSSLVSMTGGLQRSFMLPLLLAFLYCWWQRRYGLVLIILGLAAGIYPPLFLLLIVTCFLELGQRVWKEEDALERKRYSMYLIGISSIITVIALSLLPFIQEFTGSQTIALDISGNWELLSGDGRYAPGTRSTVFYSFPFVGRGGIADQGLTIIIIMFLALFASAIYWWQPERLHNFPPVLKSLFWASWITFGLAWLGFFLAASFPIYFPNRYTQSSLLLILFIFVMIHAPSALQTAGRWIVGNTRLLFWLSLMISGLFATLFFVLPEPTRGVIALGRGPSRWLFVIVAVLLPLLTYLVSQRSKKGLSLSHVATMDSRTQKIGVGLLLLLGIVIVWALQPQMNHTVKQFRASDSERKLYGYVQHLPKDTLLAGSPGISDAIPIFGKRNVLLTLERMGPNPQAITDTLLAYYTDEPAVLLDFCREYNVDHLIVYDQDFIRVREYGDSYFYEPYHTIVSSQIGQQRSFFLESLDDSAKSFQANDISVVACTEEVLRQ
jgi:hypothetical protein